MNIKYRKIDKDLPDMVHIGGKDKSNWIDVRASWVEIAGSVPKDCWVYHKGDSLKIFLGFAMELPDGWEAHLLPRGSTFKRYGLLQANNMGIVDSSYGGNDDEWFIPFFALRNGLIEKHDRIGQFRIQEVMPDVYFQQVDRLMRENRGGYGSTGVC